MEPFERLHFIRKKLGESQENFSKNLGVQRGSYSDVERGKVKNFSDGMLLLLRINYGVNTEWVLTGTGEPFLPKGVAKDPFTDDKEALLEKLREKDVIIEAQKKKIQSLEKRIEEIRKLIKV